MESLTDADVRVLGALIEKELTTPEHYPLSLNALTNACNQSSNRDPVVQYDEATVKSAVDRLRKYSLVRSIQRADARVMKYMHLMGEAMSLERPEIAAMCVLMLRGPQTVGEIRTRGARLFEFPSLDDVEATLNRLIARSPSPLVSRLPRQPGQKEARYVHLLSGMSDARHEAQVDVPAESDRFADLESIVESLRREVADLRSELGDLRRLFE
ncbi:MAG TPA: YceH family protein [Gemmatimonadaceae bacterium]